MSGTRATKAIAALKTAMPRIHAELARNCRTLEKHFREVQDVEFTIERGKLWMLQTRDAKRTAQAAVRIAVDLANERLITRAEAVERVSPDHVDAFLHPQFDAKEKAAAKKRGDLLATGLNVSPGAASGILAFDADTAERWGAKEKKAVIMVRPETKPDDVHGMLAARGILTSRGGRTSHAALVARQFGKPAVVGVSAMDVDIGEARVPRSAAASSARATPSPSTGRRARCSPAAEDRGAGIHRPVPREAPRLGRRLPPPRRVGQRGLPARRRAGPRLRRAGHRAVPHRAHVLRNRAPAARAADDPRARPTPSASGRWRSCCPSSARTSSASSAPWTACR